MRLIERCWDKTNVDIDSPGKKFEKKRGMMAKHLRNKTFSTLIPLNRKEATNFRMAKYKYSRKLDAVGHFLRM